MVHQGEKYTRLFYEGVSGNYHSAEIIVPMLLPLLKPGSVVDLGCGTGAWLKAFSDNGIVDVHGLDGPWVNTQQLQIPEMCFQRANLESPPSLDRRFDLAISLEVAEHLDAEHAESFVIALTRLADVIVFSAAIPFQGGSHHVNEQWPDYWIQKFKARHYECFDILRPKLWDNPDVRWWYAQNTMIFIKSDRIKDFPEVALWLEQEDWQGRAMVHPSKFLQAADPKVLGPKNALKMMLKSL